MAKVSMMACSIEAESGQFLGLLVEGYLRCSALG